MSDRIIKLMGTELSLAADTPTTVGNAQLVRLTVQESVLITVKDGLVTTGTCTVQQGSEFFLRKKATETIQVDKNNVTAVAVGFGD